MRIGSGYDVHRLAEGIPLWLGGVRVEHTHGLVGHSDADVLVHAICDALLGAAALGDIGKHFPDSDTRYKGISSLLLLGRVGVLVAEAGYSIGNIDSTVVAQRPKLAPYINQMRQSIADTLHIDVGRVSVKATTTEQLGFEGREEGISATAVALLFEHE
ncbi:MAG: 2-C-methyl-D-erythritol 2,4-cyclodiphosphate synthase [Bacteroidales bacterium]|nr:2-C-methyl-D-erythritol 2,4-cyclodiphosphate synthase [Bacteroidales bacterium]